MRIVPFRTVEPNIWFRYNKYWCKKLVWGTTYWKFNNAGVFVAKDWVIDIDVLVAVYD